MKIAYSSNQARIYFSPEEKPEWKVGDRLVGTFLSNSEIKIEKRENWSKKRGYVIAQDRDDDPNKLRCTLCFMEGEVPSHLSLREFYSVSLNGTGPIYSFDMNEAPKRTQFKRVKVARINSNANVTSNITVESLRNKLIEAKNFINKAKRDLGENLEISISEEGELKIILMMEV